MLIQYLEEDLGAIRIIADEIAALIIGIDTDPPTYIKVQITAKINCGSDVVVSYLFSESLTDDTHKFYFTNNTLDKLIIFPSFFGITEFKDCIVRFDIKMFKSDEEGNITGYVLISNCAFIDVTYKCRVAALLQNIISENKNGNDNEKVSTITHLLHYALFNGSNCGCNCEELCDVFEELTSLIQGIDPQIINDCGC